MKLQLWVQGRYCRVLQHSERKIMSFWKLNPLYFLISAAESKSCGKILQTEAFHRHYELAHEKIWSITTPCRFSAVLPSKKIQVR